MVMKQSMMAKNLLQSIRKSLGRYIAIAVIIALGAAMFVGLRSTKVDMVATGQVYMEKQNMFDLRLLSSYGWGKEQLEDIAALDGIVDAEGVFYTDLIMDHGDGGEASVYRFYTIPEKVDQLVLLSGRMPENGGECLADGFRNKASVIGKTIRVTEDNSEDSLEKLNYQTFEIVGLVSSPLFMDMNRGNTSVGSGNIANYFYVPEDAFDVDYYSEIHVTIPGDYYVYTDAYNDAMSNAADALEPLLAPFADERRRSVRKTAREAYRDGVAEYEDGLQEYLEKKADAEQELFDAFQSILDGEDELRHSERQLIDGEQKIKDGRESIRQGKKTIAQSRQTLASTKAEAYERITSATAELMEYVQDLSERRQEITADQVTVGADLLEANLYVMQIDIGLVEVSEAEAEQARKKQKEAQAEYDRVQEAAQLLDGELADLEAQLVSMAAQSLAMEQQFNAAESQLNAAESQLAVYEEELDYQVTVIADGWVTLEEGKEEWKQGIRDYREGKIEANEKFAEAEADLAEAEEKLADAHQMLLDMSSTDVYILDRNTNMGYNSLDSASDIVAGVSKVFPVFFIAVAALVCITTMTRMVDEERTQIGTLKALGYSSGAIISKYLIYAGSSAVVGCFIGVAAGSVIFPMVLWEAYKIMIFITPQIVLRFDWGMALSVLATYTTAMLIVTWYCCHRALEEVPAELIRPKAPSAGKQLFMEKMFFWKNLSFLNKVAIRNIFRYRQRLAMMLLGIGGCTALLMTGYGIRDSISKIVDIQFQEVTVYDMEVYFRENCDEQMQADFRNTMAPYAKEIHFFNQISGEISTNNQTRDIYLITSDAGISDYMDFHADKEPVELPGTNEVLLSAGIADIMDLHVGDMVTMRNPDMEALELTVSGIYDNHVFNYAIITPDTVEAQWGRIPDLQMAFVKVIPGQDVYAAGGAATGADHVMNVTVSDQQAEMVGTMMAALDLVVWVVVFCAGLLAVIVLYNLTNINITERIREIATIKVLGFNAMETAMYVFKENLVLSIMGTVFGLPLGKLLLDFVISQIKIDMIWLKTRLEWQSLAISVVLTILSAVVVDGIFYFKLDKINMAEALKSVE